MFNIQKLIGSCLVIISALGYAFCSTLAEIYSAEVTALAYLTRTAITGFVISATGALIFEIKKFNTIPW